MMGGIPQSEHFFYTVCVSCLGEVAKLINSTMAEALGETAFEEQDGKEKCQARDCH